jgi:hypothetical protein
MNEPTDREPEGAESAAAILRLAEEIGRVLGAALAKEPSPEAQPTEDVASSSGPDTQSRITPRPPDGG